jgi:hypothetical protein
MASKLFTFVGEAPPQRRKPARDSLAPVRRAPRRKAAGGRFFKKVRRIFIFLLGAAIVTFLLAHWNDLNSVAAQKVGRVMTQVEAKNKANDALRQSALNHENEVNEAGK